MSLVKVPWQPSLYVHEDLLVKLQAIEKRLGRPPYLYGSRSGWRSYQVQSDLYDAYQNGTGPVASNPDTGNRTHMRGVAADLRDISPAMQAACVAVGLQRDYAEAWHWQLPTWRSYPIIKTLPAPPTPPTTRRRPNVTLFYRTSDNRPETAGETADLWALAGESPGTSANWIESTSRSFARDAAASHGPAVFLTHASFDLFRSRYSEPLKIQGGATVDAAAIAQAVNAALADDFAKIPTADQTAQATRKAIVAEP